MPYAPTADDLAAQLRADSSCDDWHPDWVAETLQAVSQRRLTPEQLAALAVARQRLAELQAAACVLDGACEALARQLVPRDAAG